MYWVYILRCRDHSYYVGQTQDLIQRLALHSAANGPAYTASRLPVRLVYQETCTTLDEAVRREKQLKRWSRAKKQALISGELAQLKELAASHQKHAESKVGELQNLSRSHSSTLGAAST